MKTAGGRSCSPSLAAGEESEGSALYSTQSGRMTGKMGGNAEYSSLTGEYFAFYLKETVRSK